MWCSRWRAHIDIEISWVLLYKQEVEPVALIATFTCIDHIAVRSVGSLLNNCQWTIAFLGLNPDHLLVAQCFQLLGLLVIVSLLLLMHLL